MKLEYTPAAPEQATKENIVLAGEEIGTVHLTVATPSNYLSRDMYHAVFPSKAVLLIQGHGVTRELAIVNALKAGRETAARLLIELDALESKLAGLEG